MDLQWLLCNKCFDLWNETTPNLFLTECKHVFCGKCASKLGGICFVCEATGFRITPIGSSMIPAIGHLFTNLEKSVDSLTKMSDFQNKQWTIMANYTSFLEKEVSELTIADLEVSEDMEKISQQFDQKMLEYNQLIEYRAQAAINQTPMNSHVNFAKRAREEHNQSPNPQAQAAAINQTPTNSPVNFVKRAREEHNQRSSSQAQAAINQTPMNPRRNVAKRDTVDAKKQNCNAPMQVDSDDSGASGSTIRAARSPVTRDGVFRVPTTPKLLRKIGISIGSSGALRKRKTSHNEDRGYASDSRL